MKIPFNKPYISQVSYSYVQEVLQERELYSGFYSEKCKELMKHEFGFQHSIFTPSCTSALELCALLVNIKPNDEVIVPSYTYVSSANAFALRGAKIIFADVYENCPNADISKIENLITKKTKAVVIVHYGGIAIELERLIKSLKEKNIILIEDAAHSIGATYQDKFLGSFGDLSVFSFHETKNITCGQGGALIVNNDNFWERALVLKECGTDKIAFSNQKVNNYQWQDLGSNYNLSNTNCAILYASLCENQLITKKRLRAWNYYMEHLLPLQKSNHILLPYFKPFSFGNGHIFYLLVKNETERRKIIRYLSAKGIQSVFHYQPLNESPFIARLGESKILENAHRIANRIIRLPLFFEITEEEQGYICASIFEYFKEINN